MTCFSSIYIFSAPFFKASKRKIYCYSCSLNLFSKFFSYYIKSSYSFSFFWNYSSTCFFSFYNFIYFYFSCSFFSSTSSSISLYFYFIINFYYASYSTFSWITFVVMYTFSDLIGPCCRWRIVWTTELAPPFCVDIPPAEVYFVIEV